MTLFNAFYSICFYARVIHPGFFVPIYERENMKRKKSNLIKFTKESKEDRKKRVSCGVKYRAAVFENKKKRQKYKYNYSEEMM